MNTYTRHYQFYIYSDNGTCIYKLSSDTNLNQSMQGIIQALYYTASDYHSELKIISTEIGVLSYKSYTLNDRSLLLAIIIPDNFGDEELCELLTERIIEYLYNILVIHIGLTDLYCNSQNEIELLKRLIDVSIDNIGL
jgi:hypothetical protein